MTKEEEIYHRIAQELPGAIEGKMFGALCIKAEVNGKALAMFYKNQMVFKLDGEKEKEALSLDGAERFDPMGGKPMGGWIQVPFEHADKWKELAEYSLHIVNQIPPKEKKKAK